jgi:hypothetical protein
MITLDSFILSSGGSVVITLVARELISRFTMPKNGSTPMTKSLCEATMKGLTDRLTLGEDRFVRIEEKIDKLLLRRR